MIESYATLNIQYNICKGFIERLRSRIEIQGQELYAYINKINSAKAILGELNIESGWLYTYKQKLKNMVEQYKVNNKAF